MRSTAASCGNQRRRLLLSYTKLLAAHVNGGRHKKALSLFSEMRSSPNLPALDPFAFPLALKSCAALRLPRATAALHAHTVKVGLLSSSPFVSSALIDAYGKCLAPSVVNARHLFDELSQRNAVVWNAMIALYSRVGDVGGALRLLDIMDVPPIPSTYNPVIAALAELGDNGASRALQLHRQMQAKGVKPNLITVLALFPACVGVAALNSVKEIHGFAARNSILPEIRLSSGLVEAYGRCGSLIYARRIFDEIDERDVVAWSSMVSAYAFHGEAETAMSLFRQMETAGVSPDGIMFLGVLKACSHAGMADEAQKYFELMQKDYGMEPGSDHYACLVDVLSRAGRLHEAYNIIEGMPVRVTAKAWGALLGACRNYGEVGLAEIAGRALFEIEPDNAGNFVLLASIYTNAGMFEEADRVRREMEERCVYVGQMSTVGSQVSDAHASVIGQWTPDVGCRPPDVVRCVSAVRHRLPVVGR
ncbi:hypothetical protein Taro_032611 [Colocasia esculenta]|uniref:Pentatricopeptide repeat-containing protein n=1 Tax=Colocasia esculenta TaxID=4460 RepID=A0A843VVE0_COLES|nr:hypothetical protein [Colocasia esculenta]